MALEKIRNTPFGVEVSYHKVATINISWHTRECSVYVYSYLSKEIRELEKAPLTTYYYDFVGNSFTFDVEQNISEQVYNKLKEMEEWEGATDC